MSCELGFASIMTGILRISRTSAHDKKVALITGVTGKDGASLAGLLLSKSYPVHGVRRRSSSHNTSAIDRLEAIGADS